jgi:AraC-like DNA-binding protein
MARPFLYLPVSEIEDRVVDAELLLPDILSVRDRLLESHRPADLFCLIQRYLLERIRRMPDVHDAVQGAVRAVTGDPGGSTVERLVHQCGYSHRHFLELFRQNVGVNPKDFVRISRFQHAVRTIEARGSVHWAQLATECGYYDQAHFINEFRAFSGLTPSAYMGARGDTLNYLPLP